MHLSRGVLMGVALAMAQRQCGGQSGQAAPGMDAAGIMARVASNQDAAEAARSHYVYVQHSRVVSRKGKTVMCEETMDARVTPSGSDSHVEMLKLNGRVLKKGSYVVYSTLLPTNDGSPSGEGGKDLSITLGDDETDRQLVEHMRANLTNDKTKDGIGTHLFPLTTKSQKDYTFELAGREHMNGREVFHIRFRPKEKDEYGWKGDAYIDAAAYQPVVVRTDMAKKIPFPVRTLLGTSLPGLGFTVIYAPQADGVWFPASFGTEFKMHILFFFRREILLNAENRNFEKTHTSAKIVDGSGLVELQ